MEKKLFVDTVLGKIVIGAGIVVFLAISSLGLTAFIDGRVNGKMIKQTETISNIEMKIDTINNKVDDMSQNINSIFYVICKDSLTEKEVSELKKNKIIK
jgi:hypothetical protein